jgi:hypothetical protein
MPCSVIDCPAKHHTNKPYKRVQYTLCVSIVAAWTCLPCLGCLMRVPAVGGIANLPVFDGTPPVRQQANLLNSLNHREEG